MYNLVEFYRSLDTGIFVILLFMVMLILSFCLNLSQRDEIKQLKLEKISMVKRNLEVINRIEEIESEVLEMKVKEYGQGIN